MKIERIPMVHDELDIAIAVNKIIDYINNNSISTQWKPKEGEKYYYISSVYSILYDKNSTYDTERIQWGNYFKTEQEAQDAVDYLKEKLKQYKDEK